MAYQKCRWCGGAFFVDGLPCPDCGRDGAQTTVASSPKSFDKPAATVKWPGADVIRPGGSLKQLLRVMIAATVLFGIAAFLFWKYQRDLLMDESLAVAEINTSFVLTDLSSTDAQKRYQACQNLQTPTSAGAPPSEALAAVVALLKDPAETVRGSCVGALRFFGVAAKDALPDLISLLHDPSLYPRMTAAESLGAIAALVPEDTQAAPALGEALRDPQAQVRRFALVGLSAMGERAKPATPALLDAFNRYSTHESADFRVEIVQLLGTLAAKSEGIAPTIARAIRDPDQNVHESAMEALRSACQFAGPIIPDLAQLMHDQDEGIRKTARYALNTCCTESDAPPDSAIHLVCQRHAQPAHATVNAR